jgi:diketogulonate reductase-like aldo/keto reductase
VDFCLGSAVQVVTNDPYSKGLRLKNGIIKSIADRLETTVEQLMFRWAITKGYITLIPPNARTSVGVDVDELSKSLDAGMKTNCFF